jgi:hypothetical protein
VNQKIEIFKMAPDRIAVENLRQHRSFERDYRDAGELESIEQTNQPGGKEQTTTDGSGTNVLQPFRDLRHDVAASYRPQLEINQRCDTVVIERGTEPIPVQGAHRIGDVSCLLG